MDSGSRLSGNPGHGDERRVEELLRVNARLAAELRSLALGRAEAPRPGAMTAPRKIGSLTEQRDRLREHLDAADAGLKTLQEQCAALAEQCVALERDRDALADEVRRLRGGWRGLARRARARLLRR